MLLWDTNNNDENTPQKALIQQTALCLCGYGYIFCLFTKKKKKSKTNDIPVFLFDSFAV